MITLITKTPSRWSKEHLKDVLRDITGRKRGPKAVADSLDRGLTELAVTHQINPPVEKWSGTVHVIHGVSALKKAIALKKTGVITKLIAGPNIVVTPLEHEKIMFDPAIDLIIQPSQWTKDVYVSVDPSFTHRVAVWPAGVRDNGQTSPRTTGRCLVYQKNASKELLRKVTAALTLRHIPYTVLTYGTFEQHIYYELLERSDFMIYLSASESQGIALNEAWMRDVPSLVWNRGFWEYGTATWKDPSISAPYLTEQTGLFFTNMYDMEERLDTFIKALSSFTPRAWSLQNSTDRVCAQKYLDILDTSRN